MTTTVRNTVLNPDDTPALRARVRIQLAGVDGAPVVGYLISDGSAVEGLLRLGVDDNGVWAVPLVPNSLIAPSGTVYRVVERRGTVIVNDVPITVPDDDATHELAGLITDYPGSLPTSALEAAIAALATVYQPLDSDLTAIAALSTTSFGRGLLTLVDAAATRTALALGSAATQPSSAFEPTGAVTAAINALVGAAPGTLDTLNELAAALADDPNFATTITTALAGKQPLDSDLTAIAALSTTSFGRGLLAVADAASLRTAAGLGTAATANTGDFDAAGAAAAAQAASQPVDSDLSAIAALSTTAYGRALLTLPDAAALTAALNVATESLKGLLSAADKTTIDNLAATYQPLDSDLTAIAALSTTAFGRDFLALADAAAARTKLALGTAATQPSTAFDAAGAAAAAQASSQPASAVLTTLAGNGAPGTLGLTILLAASAAAGRTALGLGTAAMSATTDFDAAGAAAAEATTARAAELALQDGLDQYLRATCS